MNLFAAAPLVEEDKETDEGNFHLWRLEKGVAEGSTEIPKGVAHFVLQFRMLYTGITFSEQITQ